MFNTLHKFHSVNPTPQIIYGFYFEISFSVSFYTDSKRRTVWSCAVCVSINNCRSRSGLFRLWYCVQDLHPDSSFLHLQLVMEVLLLDTRGQRQLKSLLLIFLFVGNSAGQSHNCSTLKMMVFIGSESHEICSRHHFYDAFMVGEKGKRKCSFL